MTEEIQRCPFCGQGEDLKVYHHGHDEPDCFVQCGGCTTTGPAAVNDDLAIAAWNRRTVPPILSDAQKNMLIALGEKWMSQDGRDELDEWLTAASSNQEQHTCNYPLCQSQAEQQRIAAQVHAELYSGIPPELLAIATGYESGTFCTGPEDLSGTINLHYQSPAEAEAAFECIARLIDFIVASRPKDQQ